MYFVCVKLIYIVNALSLVYNRIYQIRAGTMLTRVNFYHCDLGLPEIWEHAVSLNPKADDVVCAFAYDCVWNASLLQFILLRLREFPHTRLITNSDFSTFNYKRSGQ